MDYFPDIEFDDEARIRVLQPDLFVQSEQLAAEGSAFVSKVGEFNGLVDKLSSEMKSAARTIENEKIRAIGQRSRLENESEEQERQRSALRSLVKERQEKLQRYEAQYESLLKVELEQSMQIERLQRA